MTEERDSGWGEDNEGSDGCDVGRWPQAKSCPVKSPGSEDLSVGVEIGGEAGARRCCEQRDRSATLYARRARRTSKHGGLGLPVAGGVTGDGARRRVSYG